MNEKSHQTKRTADDQTATATSNKKSKSKAEQSVSTNESKRNSNEIEASKAEVTILREESVEEDPLYVGLDEDTKRLFKERANRRGEQTIRRGEQKSERGEEKSRWVRDYHCIREVHSMRCGRKLSYFSRQGKGGTRTRIESARENVDAIR